MSEAKLDRRAFFRKAGRTIALGGIAAVSALLLRKRAKAGQLCINDSICGKCPVVDSGCVLPQAMSYRDVRAKGGFELKIQTRAEGA